MCLAVLCGCLNRTSDTYARKPLLVAQIDTLKNAALSWHIPVSSQGIRGLRLLRDGRPFAHRNLAVARSILGANPRIGPFDALQLADFAIGRAEHYGLNPEFLCATLLQESAFDPDALSNAGAVGLGQFTLDTASAYHVDPFDARDAIRGSALLLAAYVSEYRNVYDDPYAAALAAYNAGPDAVRRYHGVPPYQETQTYISDVYDRWARIISDERF